VANARGSICEFTTAFIAIAFIAIAFIAVAFAEAEQRQ
jgi:hypothetical protein